MKYVKRILIVAATAHLALVGWSAAERSTGRSGVAARVLGLYGALSGANNSYSFFAPGVPLQMRMWFEVLLPDGSRRRERLSPGVSDEADRRVDNTLTSSFAQAQDETLRRALLSSWAAKVFARYPGAEDLTVHVEIYDLPTMQDFRKGRRPAWRSLLKERFVRDWRLTQHDAT